VNRKAGFTIGAFVLAVIVAGALLLGNVGGYSVKFVVPSAAQLAEGSPVLIRGFQVGKVTSLEARDNKAIVGVTMSGNDTPLHDGTTTSVEWSSALGERFLTVFPGPATNAEIPAGGMITGASKQIEVDQVVSALDPPTRGHVDSLLQQLDGTFQGNDQDLKATLQSTGPTVQAVGEVLKGVGQDGPAIRSLVTQLDTLISTAANRQDKLRHTITSLDGLTGAVAANQRQLADGLKEVPSTLRTANDTLTKLHPATEATVPLLKDLRPGMKRLVGVSRDLSPLMHDLRPALKRLRPTVESLHTLLGKTPDLLDSANGDLPTITNILHDYQPAASFIRPYTPELAGWLSNWGSTFGAFDSQGHYWPGLVAEGPDGFHDNVERLPSEKLRATPKPGVWANQPWDDPDATGSEPR
jgi:phospholipid/cholesterol/gamma-HCH transport system substrate-binding protein